MKSETKKAPITKDSELLEVVREIRAAMTHIPMLAIDTEFIRESTFFPIVELLQVATRDHTWVIDAQAFRGRARAGLEPLLELFRDPSILKVMHAAGGDQECLYTSYKCLASPVLDTAVAASLLGLGDNIGLGPLLNAVVGVKLPKGHSRTDWSKRPLPDFLIEYAHQDVAHLVEAAQVLFEQLEKKGRKNWALDLSKKSADPKLYESDPLEWTIRLSKSRKLDENAMKVLYALIQWRESRVRELDIPRRWLAEDPMLLDIATVQPKTLDHLQQFRGLNKGEIKKSGDALLKIISNAQNAPCPPELERAQVKRQKNRLSVDEEHILEILKSFISVLSSRAQVAAKHVLTTSQMQALLQKGPWTQERLIEEEVLTPEAGELFGNEIVEFLNGNIGISLVDGRVQWMRLTKS